MITEIPFRGLRHYLGPRSATPGTDDTNVMARLIYHNPAQSGAATYSVDSATADSLVLVDPVNGTITLAFATYTNMGLLADKVNTYAGWSMVLVGATRAHPTINGTTTLLLANAAATAKTATGVNIYADSSALNYLNVADTANYAFCYGYEDIVKDIRGIDLKHFARTSKRTIPDLRDPILGNVLARTQPLGAFEGAAAIKSIVVKATFGSGDTTLIIRKCSQQNDGEAMTVVITTSATEQTIDYSKLSADGLLSGPGERFVLELVNRTAAISAVQLTINGQLGIVG
jgi:hypothetical protein